MRNLARSILPIGAQRDLPESAGAKAHGLARMIALGLPVPPGWVVLPNSNRDESQRLAEELRAALPGPLMVRSSATEEDAASMSFAGIHRSLLGVSHGDLADAVKRVAMSPFSERARAYRRAMGLVTSAAPAAVIVQPLLAARRSGVAFDGTDDSAAVRIECVRGTGDRLHAGGVRPERVDIAVNNGAWHIVDRRRGSDLPEADLLEEAEALEIARAVGMLRAVYEGPVDVEWVVAERTIWFVQVRPQTRPIVGRLPPGETWTRANLGETFPEIPSAFTRSLLTRISGRGMARMLRACGLPSKLGTIHCTCVYGRPVLNERMYTVATLLGMAPDHLRSHVGTAVRRGRPPRRISAWRVLRYPMIAARSFLTLRSAEPLVRAALTRLDDAEDELRATDLGNCSTEELAALARGPYLGHVEDAAYLASCLFAALVWRHQSALVALRGLPNPEATLARLVVGGASTISARRVEDLVVLADGLRGTPTDPAFFDRIGAEHAQTSHWRTHLGREAWSRVATYLATWGHRGPLESDLATPRMQDDLRVLARELVPLITEPPVRTADDRRQARHQQAQGAWAGVSGSLGVLAHARLRRLIGCIQRLTALREALRDRTMALTGRLRGLVLELGRRLQQNERLGRARDVWHLSAAMLERAVEDPHFDAHVEVARERSRRAAWGRVRVPLRFASEDVPFDEPADALSMQSGAVLHGTPVSPGIVEGTAHVLDAPSQGCALEAGAVLVARSTDPGWTPLFVRAGAVISEMGGTLSHTSIVARELGLPCVTDIAGVTRLVRTRDRVLVDGDRGIVAILARQERP